MKLVHYSREPVAGVQSVTQRDTADMKPRGFWVSDDACEDNWRAWCEAEKFSLARLACVHDVHLRPDARVLRLASPLEIDDFSQRHGEPDEYFLKRRMGTTFWRVRWADVAAEYQGIVITPYQWSRRLEGGSSWYYGWDCASGCIWDADAIASITLREQVSEAA